MTALELFAGAGGTTHGMLAAGIDVVRCVEWDASAHLTAIAAGHPSVQGDVRDPAMYADLPSIDLLWSSFPCQEFSAAGKRAGAAGTRNGWPWTVAGIDLLRAAGNGPTWLIAENVVGLTTHSGAAHEGEKKPRVDSGKALACPGCYFWTTILPDLVVRFAHVQSTILDAADYGVPQHRRRIFIVAGPHAVSWPRPTHGDPAMIQQTPLFGPRRAPWITVRQALNLDGVLRPERGAGMAERHGSRRDEPTSEPATTIRAVGSPRLQVVYRRGREGGTADEAHSVDEPACALRGSPGGSSQPFLQSGVAGHSAPHVYVRSSQWTRRLDPDAPAPTVDGASDDGGARPMALIGTATTMAGAKPELLDRPSPTVAATESKGASSESRVHAVNRASDAYYMATGIRRLSPAECAALQSFPPDYPWRGTKTAIYRQIGNAVPPPMAEVVGRAVINAIEARKQPVVDSGSWNVSTQR